MIELDIDISAALRKRRKEKQHNCEIINPHRFGSAGGGSGDPYWANVILLLQGGKADGTNAFVDASPFARVVSRIGAPVFSVTRSKWGSESSIFFNNASALSVPGNANLGFGTGDFTVEFWASVVTSAAFNDRMFTSTMNNSTGWYMAWDTSANYMRHSSETDVVVPNGMLNTVVWKHYAYTRQAGAARGFVDGVLRATKNDVNSAKSLPALSGIRIGCGDNGSGAPTYYVNGYFDDIRITTACRYTANFVPPAARFPNSP